MEHYECRASHQPMTCLITMITFTNLTIIQRLNKNHENHSDNYRNQQLESEESPIPKAKVRQMHNPGKFCGSGSDDLLIFGLCKKIYRST